MKFHEQNNVWHGKEYYLKNNLLKSEGDNTDKSAKNPVGNFNNYCETGKLNFTASYINGKPIKVTYWVEGYEPALFLSSILNPNSVLLQPK